MKSQLPLFSSQVTGRARCACGLFSEGTALGRNEREGYVDVKPFHSALFMQGNSFVTFLPKRVSPCVADMPDYFTCCITLQSKLNIPISA